MIFNNRVDVFEEIKRLQEELEQERRLRKEWQEKALGLEKKVNALEATLNRILNPDTPSSQIPDTEKETNRSPSRDPVGSHPKGKPPGGNGATKSAPTKIHRQLNATRDSCTRCQGKNLQHIETEEVLVWDLPVIQLMVTLFYIFIYRCKDCGALVRGTHSELPLQGMIGPHLAAFLAEIKHNFAASYEKLSSFLLDMTGETFSAQAINDCIIRTASKLEPKYKEIQEALLKESVLHSDETRWPINGIRHYLWLLHGLNAIFIAINKSRARKVITEILGEYYDGVIVSDCLAVYRSFAAAFQKCWAHLLRRTFFMKKNNPTGDIVQLHDQLTALYEEAERYRIANLTDSERIWTGIRLTQKLQRITYTEWKSNEAKLIIENWLKAFSGQWLVGVFIPQVEFTNNKDERGIRKVIPTRKMLGGHRTEEGAKDFAIIETNRQTWKLQGKSPHAELVKYLCEDNINALAAA
jgi:transposase